MVLIIGPVTFFPLVDSHRHWRGIRFIPDEMSFSVDVEVLSGFKNTFLSLSIHVCESIPFLTDMLT
jgi:hypothetical protein